MPYLRFTLLCLGLCGLMHHPAAAGEVEAHAEAAPANCPRTSTKPVVRLETEFGQIDAELARRQAPITVCNFLRYVQAGFFDGGSFLRTVRKDNQVDKPVKIAVIQADVPDARAKEVFAPIPLERTTMTGVRHVDGALSMARDKPDTATASFSICVGAQPEMDYGGHRNPDGQGFAAFGHVIRGMDVVRQIQAARAVGERLDPPILIKRAFLLRE